MVPYWFWTQIQRANEISQLENNLYLFWYGLKGAIFDTFVINNIAKVLLQTDY